MSNTERVTILLTLKGERHLAVIKRLRNLLPHLPYADVSKIVNGVKPQKVMTISNRPRAKNIIESLALVGATAVVVDEHGNTIEWVEKVESYDPDQILALAQAKAKKDEEERIARELTYPVELPHYFRYALFDTRGIELSYKDHRLLEEWCVRNLRSLYRIRRVRSSSRSFFTIELTSEIDALFLKMWWQDNLGEVEPNEIEWVWQTPTRLFGDNGPSLAFEINKSVLLHPTGVPYQFAEGTELGLWGNLPEAIEVVTKGELLALAPNEAQRDKFMKFCVDYDVMVHSVSEPFTDTVVDVSLFNAIVSVDPGGLDTFKAVWSTAFDRFHRDTALNSVLSVSSARRSTAK